MSIVGLDAVKLVMLNAGIVICEVVALTVTGVEAESVTLTVNSQPVVEPVGVYVNDAAFPGLLKPGHVPVFVHE